MSATGDKKSFLEKLGDVFSPDPKDEAELKELLRDAADRQLLDGEALNIIFGALQISDMQARDILIPRSQLVFLQDDDSIEQLLPTLLESKHSRFPVIGDDLDDVKGILHAKDLLPLLLQSTAEREKFDMRDCIRPVTIVPESKRLNVLLQEFRTTRNHMAVVVDEYGHTAGAVTIEDVLEQIVGEIEDEHDVDDDSFIKEHNNGEFTVKAATEIEDFNEYFDTEFDDEEFDTVGGLVLQAFGRLPKRGETTELEGFNFTVLNADSRRIRLLRAQRLD